MTSDRSVTADCAGDGCGERFTPRRSDARYCSQVCRQRAYRIRHERPRPLRKRRPITDAWRDAVFDFQRAADRVDRLMGDDRFKAHADDLFAIGMASVSRAGTVADMFLGIYRDTYPLAEVRRRARAARSVTHESAGDS